MATYASLNAEDKKIVDNTVNLIRGAASLVFRSFNRIKAIADDSNATGLVLSIDPNEVIPNTSSLPGSDELTRTEIVTLYNLINGIRTTNDTAPNRASASKAVGADNLMGA